MINLELWVNYLINLNLFFVQSGEVVSISNIEKDVNSKFFIKLGSAFSKHNLIKIIIIPKSIEYIFNDYFFVNRDKTIENSNYGKILAVKEVNFDDFTQRECLISFPITYLQNTTYRAYIDNYKEKLGQMCKAYLVASSEHPIFNYLDEGNFFYTKFFLNETGKIITLLGKTSSNYQYITIFDRDVEIDKYNELIIKSFYRKKVREISIITSENQTHGDIIYKGINLYESKFLNEINLFEVERVTTFDLVSVPKQDILLYSKIKENSDISAQLLSKFASLGENDFIELPSKLKLGKNKVMYENQELSSSIITPEDFLFNTKKTFPAFEIDYTNRDECLYIPLVDSINLEDLDWDTYLNSFIKYHWIKAIQYPSITLIIGNVKILLEYKNNLYYINKARINKMEVPKVIAMALCYQEGNYYDNVVNIISKTSLKIHKFISTGLVFSIYSNTIQNNLLNQDDNFKDLKQYLESNKDIRLFFKLVRIKNLNYLELPIIDENGQKTNKLIKIKDIRKLMSIHEKNIGWSKFKSVFENYKILEYPGNFTIENSTIITILNESKEKYIRAFNKSKELLDNVLKVTDSKIMEFKNHEGVLVTGLSGNQYFINVDNLNNPLQGDPDCSVYLYPTGEHICIVDKTSSVFGQIGVDKVVSRIFALKNDKLVSEHIHTVKNYLNQE